MHVFPGGNGSSARKSARDLRKNAHLAQVGMSPRGRSGFVATPCGRRTWRERPREIGVCQFDGALVGRLRGTFRKSRRRRGKQRIKLISARCAIFWPYSLYGYSLEREISAFGRRQFDDRGACNPSLGLERIRLPGLAEFLRSRLRGRVAAQVLAGFVGDVVPAPGAVPANAFDSLVSPQLRVPQVL